MNRQISFALASCGLFLGCASAGGDPAAALELAGVTTTSAFQDGVAPSASYAGTRDTMLEQDHASTSHGSDKKLSVSGDTPSASGEDDVALIRWELGATIPTSAVVRSATITLAVTDKADQPYQLFEALRGWDEATATWKRASSSVNWTSNGADGAGDRGAAVLGTIRAAATGTFQIALTSAGVATVQRWVADPSTNHGVIVAGASNDNRLEVSSREDSKASRPRLAVTWEPGGTGSGSGGLDPTPGTYQQTCDGSAGVALDATHFLDFSDEDQVARIYARATIGGPVQQVELGGALGLANDDEADLEDAARIGDRVYVISSHGRDKDGQLQPTRYRLFAIDLAGAVPSLRLTVAGWTDQLVIDLLDASRWDHPDAAVLSALAAATQRSRATVADLAPEVHGLNLEGLAAYPSPTNPDRLLLGLRNPQAAGRALLITLLNPAEVIAGAAAHFGEAITLDLGGLGVRGLAWSEALHAMLVIGGPIADAGAVRLFTWSGDPASTPVAIQDLASAASTAAEAVIAYPGTTDVQVVFDAGGQSIGGTACKKLAASAQSFTDQIIHLE